MSFQGSFPDPIGAWAFSSSPDSKIRVGDAVKFILSVHTLEVVSQKSKLKKSLGILIGCQLLTIRSYRIERFPYIY